MQFNSIDFAVFLPIVYILYWSIFNRNIKIRNLFLLTASYFFYGWWDWRFLFLIIFVTCVDFYTTRMMVKNDSIKKKRLFLFISLFTDIGLLFFFKYFNFFTQSFSEAYTLFGKRLDFTTLNIILPLGISFYIFQTLSYVFDVYYEKIEPTKDIIIYSAFLSFFPKLVMGPIEKPGNLLPQFTMEKKFDYDKTIDGLREILWGLFKKIVIADNCAVYVNTIFDNYKHYNGITLLLGAILYAVQIYCDFSAYSEIAIGVGRLLGFDLMRNFAYPYFARNMAEFWRRWHISLTKWLTDYIFLPVQMKYRRLRIYGNIIAIILTFLICGLWHGANWTFIVWGFLNGVYLALFMVTKQTSSLEIIIHNRLLPSLKELFQISFTFLITVFAWIFFRAANIHTAFDYISGIFSRSLLGKPSVIGSKIIGLTLFMFLIEWLQRDKEHALEFKNIKWRPIRWGFYYLLLLMILFFGFNSPETSQFIYVLF